MSIYSGFATRNQQKYYDKVLYNVISTLMVRIVKFYKKQTIDEKAFRKIIKDQHKVITKLEKHKYADPKYSDLFQHFMKVLDKNQQEKQDQHLQFQLRRKSVEDGLILNRTLSVLGKQINELQNYTQKIDTVEFLDDLSCDKGLQLIPQRKRKQHTKKKSKKIRSSSMKSNMDIWDVRKQKLPQIPNLIPISQTILNRTRLNSTILQQADFSQKLTNKTIDAPLFEKETPNQKILQKAPNYKAKIFFK